MSDEQDKLKLSLEPPKLFGRKKKSADRTALSEAAEPAAPSPAEPAADEPVTDEPFAEPAPEEPAAADEELTAVIEDVQASEEQPAPPVAEEPTPQPVAESAAVAPLVAGEPASLDEIEREDAEIAATSQKSHTLLDLYPAAALTGLVVGAAMVALTWLSLRGCEAVRGAASCGGGGFLLLIAIFALTVLLGSALLRAFAAPDPGSSSFLAVGLVAVAALLFLIDFFDNWAMLIVIPLLSVGAYLASVWVTKTFVEPGETAI